MQTSNEGPPAYAPNDAPPAYAPSYNGPPTQGQSGAYQPPVQQQIAYGQPQPVVYQQQQQQQPVVYQQPMQVGQVPQGQPVVYMVQQPNGQLVPMQAGMQAGMQPVQTVQTTQQAGISTVPPGTTNMANQPGVTGAPGAVQVNTVYAPRPEPKFNRKTVSWALLAVVIGFCLQLYATGADTLTLYTENDGTAYWRHDQVEYDDDDSGSTTSDYDDLCDLADFGSDFEDFCDYDSSGSAFWALLWINNVAGIFVVSILGNIVGKCCTCCGGDEKGIKNQINTSKSLLGFMVLLSIISLIIWGSHDICGKWYDDADGDCGWGGTMWVTLINIFIYVIAIGFLFRK